MRNRKYKIANAVFVDAEDFKEFSIMAKIMGLESEEMFRRIWEDYKENSVDSKTGMPSNDAGFYGGNMLKRGVYLPK